MTIIGLTGNYGMGKSTAAHMFKELGAFVIDTDDIVRELLKDPAVIYEIKKAFGDDIIQQSAASGQPSEINKKKLAEIVFEHPHLRISLEDILHPRVFKRVEEEAGKINDPSAIIIVEAPVIFERGYQNRFDKIITVFASEDIAVSRLKGKGIPGEEAVKRLKSQFPIEMKIAKSDFVIDNNGDLENTKKQVKEIYNQLYV
ncbi:MAG: dephospho-CoA kinase [Nitrospirae bacterium]|nr:dephospho-CoA kinase [Nitrospirota bacterium]MCL5976958.1 dephospho-CoA kinase [Nitrospirota bacterium]